MYSDIFQNEEYKQIFRLLHMDILQSKSLNQTFNPSSDI